MLTDMTSDQRLLSERFSRSSKYHPEWIIASVSGGANPLWLTEWLTTALDPRPGMRVLDLGCGRAMSSACLAASIRMRAAAIFGVMVNFRLSGLTIDGSPESNCR
jgi:hypothetical protein